MIDTTKWNTDYIGEKVIKPMYEDGVFPLALADQIKDSIEKQIPKKPLNVNPAGHHTFECPECHKTIIYLDEKHKHNNCLNCGQKLDWNMEDEEDES